MQGKGSVVSRGERGWDRGNGSDGGCDAMAVMAMAMVTATTTA